jgi:hypothetical protein
MSGVHFLNFRLTNRWSKASQICYGQWRTQEFFRAGGSSTNAVEDRGQRERGRESDSPLVRGSAQFANGWKPDVFSMELGIRLSFVKTSEFRGRFEPPGIFSGGFNKFSFGQRAEWTEIWGRQPPSQWFRSICKWVKPGWIFHGTGNSAQLCQNFGISGEV